MKPEELDLRHSLLGSTLGTFIPPPQLETGDGAESAVAACNKPGTSCAEFPDTYDGEIDDDEPSAGLTLLPTAEYSEEEEESEDERMSSQYGEVSDDCMEYDPYTGLQRPSVLSEAEYLDAAYQGGEVARVLGGKQLRENMERNIDMTNKSLAEISASERYDAYKSVLERHARMGEKTEQQCKRQKTEHAREEESGGLDNSAKATAVPPVDILSAKYALPPETGDFVTSRTSTGRTLYFGVRTAMDAEKKQAQLAALKDEGHMEPSQINRAVANIEKALDTARITAEEDAGAADESAALWVDKYRARTFLDLVSDERTNRAVMQWLKEWDHCVFGRRSAANAEDKWRRPRQRILLLAGPPGLGKTTLAHVAARQAGYAVVEINASDDRTVSKVRDRVLGVTQTHRLGASKKPQLLIIDEIDGVSSASPDFVAMLVKLAADQPPGRRKQPPLLRPIICICNNAYAQALRPLRAMALSYHVHAPTPARLAKRLAQVCEAEGVTADSWALVELADQNAGDVRACLNALQLRRASGTALDACGTKDVQRSLFSLWAMLFTTPAASFLGSAAKKASAKDIDSRYAMLCVDAVRASGERDRLIQGCFENYLHMDFRDLTHSRVADLCSALCFYDAVDLTCRRNPATSSALHAYMDYAPLAFHRTCRTPVGLARVDFAYPHSEYDAHQQRQAAQTLAHTLAAGCLSPRASLSARTSSPGFVDFLLHILSPQLTTANKHLLKGAEKAKFERLVAVMSHWQLSFVQSKDADGQLVYKMEPPIDRLFAFAGKRPAVNVLPMRYPVRQLVAQELDRLRIARAARSDPAESTQDLAKRDYLAKLFASPLAVAQQGSAGEADVVAAPARDFFGRIVAKSTHPAKNPNQTPAANGGCLAHNGSRTWFHFFEGFSNAVRKPTQMKELF
ncbi:Chromosome transmission fidelity protein 18 [Coemansia sp. RSA 2399]|nr:Chromosome transmission fidelity protein 18 [Coemansia sp. RSA 2399]